MLLAVHTYEIKASSFIAFITICKIYNFAYGNFVTIMLNAKQ